MIDSSSEYVRFLKRTLIVVAIVAFTAVYISVWQLSLHLTGSRAELILLHKILAFVTIAC